MIEMIKYWLMRGIAHIGNTVYETANKELETPVAGVLLSLGLTVIPGFWTLGQLYPINSIGRFTGLCFCIILEFSFFRVIENYAERKLLTAIIKKCEVFPKLYNSLLYEKVQARMAGMNVAKFRKAKKKAEQEMARRQREEWERAQREKAEWEKAQREWAAKEKVRREQEEREKARREQEEREKAQKQKAEQNSSVQKARQLLRLQEAYTMSDLKKARNTLIKEFHPDNNVNGNEEMCKKINEAYDLLSKYAKVV